MSRIVHPVLGFAPELGAGSAGRGQHRARAGYRGLRHALASLAGARGDRIRCLGLTQFGQYSDLADVCALHGIDALSVVEAALDLLGR